MKIVRSLAEIRGLADAGARGLVPTMGALHDGHVALFEAARGECDLVVTSVFVNPAQFGPGEDFGSYPRDEAADAQIAERAGVDILFMPSVEELYPEGYETWVDVERASAGLEGMARPGHFRGVATVCLKLFNLVRPERAYFGQKDAQQAAVLTRMVADLNLELEIRVVPTVRDGDGLALSSRNAYLSAPEREAAAALPRALFAGRDAHLDGKDAVAAGRAVLAGEPLLAPDYLEIARFDGRVHLVAAVRAGRTRLIDNVVLEGELR
ncbi:MAG: pantoate--beta-alanine ligase [Gaiellaceae bacterium]